MNLITDSTIRDSVCSSSPMVGIRLWSRQHWHREHQAEISSLRKVDDSTAQLQTRQPFTLTTLSNLRNKTLEHGEIQTNFYIRNRYFKDMKIFRSVCNIKSPD